MNVLFGAPRTCAFSVAAWRPLRPAQLDAAILDSGRDDADAPLSATMFGERTSQPVARLMTSQLTGLEKIGDQAAATALRRSLADLKFVLLWLPRVPPAMAPNSVTSSGH